MKDMKIAIICYPTHGGSGVVASELAKGLSNKGHEIHIVSYAPPFRLDSFHQNIFIHEVGVASYPLFKYPPYALGLATKLVELAETFGIDLIHAHYAVPHAASAYLAQQILETTKIKTITTLHGTDITLVGADHSFHRVIKFTIEKSDGVTAVSEYLKTRTVEEFAIDRDIRVIHNFIDEDRTLESNNSCNRNDYAPQGEKILMHASNFRPVKRVADVVRIFDSVRKQIPSKLMLIGDGPERLFIQQLVRDLKLTDDVFFLGEQDHIEPLYFCADLFLLPSEQESFGLAALEAMACGVPVIGTETGGLPEVVLHGETGYLYPVGDIQAMSDQALETLKDSDTHSLLKKQARLRAVAHFNGKDIIGRYEDYYKEILDSP